MQQANPSALARAADRGDAPSPRIPGAAENASVAETAAQTDTLTENTAAAATRETAQQWNWETALIALWIAGIAAAGLTAATNSAKLKRRFAAAPSLPEEWQREAQRIQQELGIRAQVRFVMLEDFPSPALNASVHPTVVLPAELMGKNSRSIAFALRHELTHIKRGDHLMCLLLTLLKAVYWFSPIVWVTARLMKADMETACDSAVVSAMGDTEKKRYASTILGMYAQAQPRFVLGMALGTARQTAERRVRGIYMRRHSARGVKAAALLTAAVLLFACFTTACQPVTETHLDDTDTGMPVTPVAETPTVSESATPKPSATPAPDYGDFGASFPEKFTEGDVEKTENSYKSENINISIYTLRDEDDVICCIANIYIKNLECFKTAFPENTFGSTAPTDKVAADVNAILAINGDNCNFCPGPVLRNGSLSRVETGTSDMLVMYGDGTMQTYSPDDFDIEAAMDNGALQIWAFGPMLLNNGLPMTEFNSAEQIRNPRTAIGYYEPGHYCFVVVDGRQKGYSVGMTLSELSQLFCGLGCSTAYNLDGGTISEMVFLDSLVNQPYNGGRSTSDIVYIADISE